MSMPIPRRTALAGLAAAPFLRPAWAETGPIRIGITQLPPSLGDPTRSTSVPTIYSWAALFDGLTHVGREGIEPALAERWDHFEPESWRFFLRENIKFSNGENLTAEAVKATLDWLRGPEGLATSVSREVASIKEVRATDRLVLEIETDGPNVFLDRELATVRIVAPEAWARLGPAGFGRSPAGTGPYKLDAWEPARARLSRNPHGWRSAPTERLDILEMPDLNARINALATGEIDIAVGLGPDDVGAVRRGGGRMQVEPGDGIICLSFILTKASPLQDIRVRQALNLAVNKQAIVDGLLAGTTQVASQTCPPSAFGHDPALQPYPFDPDRARRLLAEAGLSGGFSFSCEVAAGGGASDTLVFQQIAADLARVNVTMRVKPIPVSQLIRGIQSGDWSGEAFYMNYGCAPSMDALRPMRLHSCDWSHPWYCDPAIMPTLAAARQAETLERRLALTREVLRHYHLHLPCLLLYDVVTFIGLGPRIDGPLVQDYGKIDYAAIPVAG